MATSSGCSNYYSCKRGSQVKYQKERETSLREEVGALTQETVVCVQYETKS